MASPQVLAQIGDWAICEDAQGQFFYNAVTQQSLDQPPPELIAMMQAQQEPAVQAMPQAVAAPVAAPPLQAQQQQASVKMQIGDWAVCEDSQGEFYFHKGTQQSFDSPPQELLQLIRQQQQPSAAAPVQYAQAKQYSTLPQQQSSPMTAAALPVQYKQATSYSASPPVLQYQASPQQYQASPQQYQPTSYAPAPQYQPQKAAPMQAAPMMAAPMQYSQQYGAPPMQQYQTPSPGAFMQAQPAGLSSYASGAPQYRSTSYQPSMQFGAPQF